MADRDHRALNVYDEQLDAYENAEKAARVRLGEDATVGEVVKELSEAYTGDYEYDVETATSLLGRVEPSTADTNQPAEGIEAGSERGQATEASADVGEDRNPTRPPLLLRLTGKLAGLVS